MGQTVPKENMHMACAYSRQQLMHMHACIARPSSACRLSSKSHPGPPHEKKKNAKGKRNR